MRWIEFPDPQLQVTGLPWFTENAPEVWRLPARARGAVRPPVWDLGTHPSGARIRFATDATALSVRLHYKSVGRMNNMCAIGQMGVDLYANNVYWKTAFPTEPGPLECPYFSGIERKRREISLYLPLYHPVQVVAVGVAEGATLWDPRPFALKGPAAFYGSSITQGGCASRPGLSYEAILCRALNLDFVNLGFSGNGKGEPEVAALMAEIPASCFVIDFAVNCDSVEACQKVYAPFLAILRSRHPRTPIVAITPIFSTRELFEKSAREKWAGLREVVRKAVAERRAAGDHQVVLVEGCDILGPEGHEGFVDGTHPNDLGFQAMAKALEPVLRQALRL